MLRSAEVTRSSSTLPPRFIMRTWCVRSHLFKGGNKQVVWKHEGGGGGGVQECEKEGGRKSLATVALILSKLLLPHTPPYRHIHSLTPSPPSSPRHIHSLTRTSPTITPQPPTPHTITHHPLTLHARPRTTPLPQQVQDGVDRTELRHMPSGGIAARSFDRVPAPRTNDHHHQHAPRVRHGDHRARAWW